MVQSLCTRFSPPLLSLPDPVDIDESMPPTMRTYHPFPAPSVLAAPDVAATLRTLGFGYRAEFIQRTSKMLVDANHLPVSKKFGTELREPSEKWLHTLREMPTNEAREELLKFVGVGRKVADCVLLMSLDKREVVPVDTHVHQIAIKHYGLRSSTGGKAKTAMTPKLYDEVNKRLYDVWGDYAGWAHSVLFTADLKSFSSHGLETTGTSASVQKPESSDLLGPTIPDSGLLTPSPTPSPLKRAANPRRQKREASPLLPFDALPSELATEPPSPTLTLAERVKKRRRVSGK
ncbi:hypothetical protein HGRIS_012832 [Hohenbuehelia grisea]|uniref:DNA-(apurinic or apyrimidinic site) lyase n=1 Tax=Hohenbuehelia grisea TaxID=104357 RepID=A0ABR3ITK8_9AGAR